MIPILLFYSPILFSFYSLILFSHSATLPLHPSFLFDLSFHSHILIFYLLLSFHVRLLPHNVRTASLFCGIPFPFFIFHFPLSYSPTPQLLSLPINLYFPFVQKSVFQYFYSIFLRDSMKIVLGPNKCVKNATTTHIPIFLHSFSTVFLYFYIPTLFKHLHL